MSARAPGPLWPVATAIGFVAYGALVVLDRSNGTLRDGFVPQTIAWYLVAFGAFAAAVAAAERAWRNGLEVPAQWLWLAPIAFRLLLWLTEPTLSDDVYRYLWDGHLVSSGVNPYRYPVEATELDAYDVGIRSLVNNPDLATPYLPGAEVLFGLVAAVLPLNATSMQVVMTGLDLATAGLIVTILARVGLPTHRVVLYLWNPLVIVEIAHGAHLDALMTALTLAAVVSAIPGGSTREAGVASPLLLAAASLTRGLPILAAPVLWWRWRWSHRLVFAAAAILPIALFAAGPGLGLESEAGVFGTAREYAVRWQFNASVFDTVEGLIGGPDPGSRARGLVTSVMLALTGAVALRARRRQRSAAAGSTDSARRDVRAIAVLLMSYVVLTPTFNPWYLVVVLAFLPVWAPGPGEPVVRRWIGLAPWLYLAAASSLSYLTYLDPAAHAELGWVRRVEWWPTMLLLVVVAVMSLVTAGGRWSKRPAPSPTGRLDGDGQAAPRSPARAGHEPS
ncbi:MAG: hypothetical protein OEV40_12075 [Acidimicrobiia bacterium]|nr:hypothetical protein [Acidimicrobiia bacterium]